jgi:superfamily II RNA helicase
MEEDKKMKRSIFILLVTMLVILGLGAGCGEKKEAGVTSKEVKKETQEALKKAKVYAQQQKEQYQEQIEAKIKGYDENVDELKRKAKGVKGEAKTEFDRLMDDLSRKKEAASKKVKEMKSATGQAWEDLKSGTEAALEDMEKTFKKMMKRFK